MTNCLSDGLIVCVCACVWKDLRGDPHIMGLIIEDELRIKNINRLWDDFNRILNEKNAAINDGLSR